MRNPIEKIEEIEIVTKTREDIRKMYMSDANYVDERKKLMNQLINEYNSK